MSSICCFDIREDKVEALCSLVGRALVILEFSELNAAAADDHRPWVPLGFLRCCKTVTTQPVASNLGQMVVQFILEVEQGHGETAGLLASHDIVHELDVARLEEVEGDQTGHHDDTGNWEEGQNRAQLKPLISDFCRWGSCVWR